MNDKKKVIWSVYNGTKIKRLSPLAVGGHTFKYLSEQEL